MTDMTLEQVRDELLYCARNGGHAPMLVLAYAIDAALKAQGEPVAKVVGNEAGQIYIDWAARKNVSDFVGHKLYTAPPTDDRPTWEEVRRLLARAWSECRYRTDHHETHNSYNEADRIIAEFRKEKGK